jgi:L-ribulose-5-phosphate 4-epimerase
MRFEKLRHEVWECLLELPKNRLVTMHSGTVSGRDPNTDLVVIKPTGYSYEKLTPADLVVVDLDGNVIEGDLKPSSDTSTHLYLYRHRPDVMGVVHTHSPYACIFAVLGRPIPPTMTSAALLGGEIPIGAYVPVGGDLIGKEILDKVGDAKVIIMQNHGVYAIGRTVNAATTYAVEVEDLAKITHFAMLHGTLIVLSPEQVTEYQNIYAHQYGQSAA